MWERGIVMTMNISPEDTSPIAHEDSASQRVNERDFSQDPATPEELEDWTKQYLVSGEDSGVTRQETDERYKEDNTLNEQPTEELTWPGRDLGLPPPLPTEATHATESTLKPRVVEEPVQLSEREASKYVFSQERDTLAQEIRAERQANQERLRDLRAAAEALRARINVSEQEVALSDQEYTHLTNMRAQEANTISARIRSLISRSGITFSSDEETEQAVALADTRRNEAALALQNLKEEQDNLNALLEDDSILDDIKHRLAEHYKMAGEFAEKKLDSVLRSVEHVSKRNEAFIVHMISENKLLRHNDNSNVANETTYEDDLDIVLALEPSLSASSVQPGIESGLWPGASGFLLGGGKIGQSFSRDIGTKPRGLKARGGDYSTIEEIDSSSKRTEGAEYNELVVDNPEVCGFFQHAEQDEEGVFWLGGLTLKHQYELASTETEHERRNTNSSNTSLWKTNISKYERRFSAARERGIPLYIMSKDRHMFEFLGIKADGSLEVGQEISPHDIITADAGLRPEERKKIGERLLQKTIFRDGQTQEEAKLITDTLPGSSV